MRIAVNGVYLNVEALSPGPEPATEGPGERGETLLLLHGFTGNFVTWAPFAATLGRSFSLLAVDLLGHGASDSPADPARYRMERAVEDLLALCDELDLERINLLGYSMGGRVALHLALAAPELVERLILESASPGIEGVAEREARVRDDAALAELIEREGIEAFVDSWERQPLFARQDRLEPAVRQALRDQRLRNNPVGLANSLRGAGAGAQQPLFGRLGSIKPPTLIIAGQLDRKYCDLGRIMAAAIPAARLEIVPNAGHTIHLEAPAIFEASILHFLLPSPPWAGSGYLQSANRTTADG